jgi:hypothetical protein
VRTSLLVMVVVVAAGGCVAGDPPPAARAVVDRPGITTAGAFEDDSPDLCALAAQLPSGDICQLMCDPDAMKVQLVAEGSPGGVCYEFRCGLPGGTNVSVGVCLPP